MTPIGKKELGLGHKEKMKQIQTYMKGIRGQTNEDAVS